ncbi:hypothetical protein L916_18436, partial [Phytophthora nicotianae]
MNDIMKGFVSVRGYPYVCGAVDSSLFVIARPADFDGWYCKDFYPAINMQVVCDQRRRFMDYGMRPRSYSDKKTWKVSKLDNTIQNVIPRGCHRLSDAGFTLS